MKIWKSEIRPAKTMIIRFDAQLDLSSKGFTAPFYLAPLAFNSCIVYKNLYYHARVNLK